MVVEFSLELRVEPCHVLLTTPSLFHTETPSIPELVLQLACEHPLVHIILQGEDNEHCHIMLRAPEQFEVWRSYTWFSRCDLVGGADDINCNPMLRNPPLQSPLNKSKKF